MSKLIEALRARYGTPAEALRALGLDANLLKEDPMATHNYNRDRGRGEDRRGYRSARDGDDPREIERMCKDDIRRALDDAEFDPAEIVELLAEHYPGEVGEAAREIGEDRRGPTRWAADARERRRLVRDGLLSSRPRKLGRDYGPPGVGHPDGHPIENFAERRGESRREEGMDRGHRAHDMALDGGGSPFDVERFLGPQAASIGRIGVIR